MPPRAHTCVTVGFVSGVCLAHGHGINLEVIFTAEIGEWITSFCLLLNVYAKHIWQTGLEIHLLANVAAFLSASSSSCHANGPRISTPHNMGTHKAETPGNKIFSNFLLRSLHHSPQPLQLTASLLLSSKGVNSYLYYLQINLFSETQQLFPVFHIHLSYQIITWWIISPQGGLYGELSISPWTALTVEGEVSFAGLLQSLAQEGLCLLEMFAWERLPPQLQGSFFK